MDICQIFICSRINRRTKKQYVYFIFLSNNIIMSIYYNNEIKKIYVPTYLSVGERENLC